MIRLCTIAVRAGSKGVPGKNWRPIAGLPLFAHSVRHALESGLFSHIAVSSDAPEVLSTAVEHGATDVVERPAELASDGSGKVPAIAHAVTEIEARHGIRFDTIVDLDATSPLRTVDDIRGAVALQEQGGYESVITGCEAHRNPYFNLVERDRVTGVVAVSKKPSSPLLRRQDVPEAFDMNASIYVWQRDAFLADPRVFYPTTRLFEMPPERSRDIDSALDLEYVTWLLERK
jgi:CMP-N,N'-diacetyllegionaminic acid synthase